MPTPSKVSRAVKRQRKECNAFDNKCKEKVSKFLDMSINNKPKTKDRPEPTYEKAYGQNTRNLAQSTNVGTQTSVDDLRSLKKSYAAGNEPYAEPTPSRIFRKRKKG